MMLKLIDSPVANVANIARALRSAGAELELTRDPREIARSRKIVLPGVGSFAAAMRWLEEYGIDTALRDAVGSGATLLGICVGHQLLFESSEEHGPVRGLGLIRGEVRRYRCRLPVPQIGWNSIQQTRTSALFDGIAQSTAFYFVNSYAASNVESEIASADYAGPFTAAVEGESGGGGRVFGVQFHPEKSSGPGLQVLRNFVELAA